MNTDWYYTNGRSRHGPIDEAGIRLRAQKGFVRRDTLLWRSGLSGWTRADELGFFPDDDVEPTMCAIPVPDEPPPIPRAPAAPSPAPPPPPVVPTPPPAAPVSFAASFAPPPVAPPPARSRFSLPAALPDDDDDEDETSATAFSSDERATAPSPQPPAAEAAPPPQAPPASGLAPGAAAPQEAGDVSVANWFWTMLAMAIPFVNVVLLFVFAFGDGTPASKRNWARAILLWVLVGVGIAVLFWGALLGSVASMGR